MMQYLPFADAKALAVYDVFERLVRAATRDRPDRRWRVRARCSCARPWINLDSDRCVRKFWKRQGVPLGELTCAKRSPRVTGVDRRCIFEPPPSPGALRCPASSALAGPPALRRNGRLYRIPMYRAYGRQGRAEGADTADRRPNPGSLGLWMRRAAGHRAEARRAEAAGLTRACTGTGSADPNGPPIAAFFEAGRKHRRRLSSRLGEGAQGSTLRPCARDNPDAQCLPMGFLQFHQQPQPRMIIKPRS